MAETTDRNDAQGAAPNAVPASQTVAGQMSVPSGPPAGAATRQQ
jgi:hypothetical protein